MPIAKIWVRNFINFEGKSNKVQLQRKNFNNKKINDVVTKLTISLKQVDKNKTNDWLESLLKPKVFFKRV